MRNVLKIACCLLCVSIMAPAIVAQAPELDLESCHDDLDTLRRRASDASDAAEEAHSKFEEFDDCRRDPGVYDLLGDGCQSYRTDYKTALGELESAMDDLDTPVHSAQDSCGYEFTVNRMTSLEAAKQRLCASYLRFRNSGMAPTAVLQMCNTHMSDDWCKACIGLK